MVVAVEAVAAIAVGIAASVFVSEQYAAGTAEGAEDVTEVGVVAYWTEEPCIADWKIRMLTDGTAACG